MAEHVVPQDVEADDKLIGPFGFRQVVYLFIASGALFLAYLLTKIHISLLFIPLPIAIFFFTIALPLRKDQPTEIYLAAIVRFIFTPHIRLWKADGESPLVEISAPIVDDGPKTKDISGEEASRRLSFLANLSDTQGWSSRGMGLPIEDNNTNLNDQFVSDAMNAYDVMDSEVASSIGNLLDKSSDKIRNHAIDLMQKTYNQTNKNDIQSTSATQSNHMNINPNSINNGIFPNNTEPTLANTTNLPINQITYQPVNQSNNQYTSYNNESQSNQLDQNYTDLYSNNYQSYQPINSQNNHQVSYDNEPFYTEEIITNNQESIQDISPEPVPPIAPQLDSSREEYLDENNDIDSNNSYKSDSIDNDTIIDLKLH